MESTSSPGIMETSKLVALPNGQRLYTTISQPNDKPGTPTIIIIPGVTSSITEWVVVHRLLKSKAPVLLYERPGIGESDESQDPRTAKNMARELDTLLSTLSITPPYVLVVHSYGGIISREFVELRLNTGGQDNVIGMVFVDANQEESIKLWPDANLDAISKDLDWNAVLGLTDDNVLSDAEWEAFLRGRQSERYQRTAAREMEHYIPSCKALGELKQLERSPSLLKDHPVSIIKAHPEDDLRKAFEAGVKAGNGTEEQRKAFAEKLEYYGDLNDSIQREMLKLSSKARFMDLKGCGHMVTMVRPDVIAEEVDWVLQNL